MTPNHDNSKASWTETYLQGRQSGPILIAIIAIGMAVAIPVAWLISQYFGAQIAAMVLVAAALAWALSRHGVRAVAKHTLSQCIRMRIAIAFIVLLALVLTLLPRFMKGDGTLAGSIRTYLSYGVSITGGLLSIVTVLLAVATVSWDIRERTIFLVSVKPVRRWEYLLGRWMGVMGLNLALLVIAAGGIYVFVQYLRDGQATSDLDRRIVETEVFTARREVQPQLPDFDAAVRRRVAQMQQEGYFNEATEAFMASRNLSREEAEQQLVKQLQEDARSVSELIPPGRGLRYRFGGVDVAGEAATAEGRIVDADSNEGWFRIEAPQRVVGRLVFNGPVMVQGYRGRVLRVDEGRMDVGFPPAERSHVELRSLKQGDAVTVTVEPTVQFRYKVVPTSGDRSGTMGRIIQLERVVPFAGAAGQGDAPRMDFERMYYDYSSGPLNSMTTVTLPMFGPAAEGEADLAVAFINQPTSADDVPRPVRIKYEDVSLLYRVGGFEANFLRSMLLVFFQLAFLAAMGVFFGSFLSFPVAAFACMVLLVNGWMMEWLMEAMQWSTKGVSQGLGIALLHLLTFILPDFAQTSPSQKLVDGLVVDGATVIQAGAMTFALRAVLYMLAGCLIFQRRELAGAETA